MDSEGDFAVWKRIILLAIAVIVVAGVAGVLYLWYEARSLNSAAVTNEQPLTPAEQQRQNIKSLTAPPPAANASTSAGANMPPPKAPTTLTAPPPPPKTAAEQQQEQANINALTAPAK
jgi:type IV secretory pathway VirB10-like protein